MFFNFRISKKRPVWMKLEAIYFNVIVDYRKSYEENYVC